MAILLEAIKDTHTNQANEDTKETLSLTTEATECISEDAKVKFAENSTVGPVELRITTEHKNTVPTEKELAHKTISSTLNIFPKTESTKLMKEAAVTLALFSLTASSNVVILTKNAVSTRWEKYRPTFLEISSNNVIFKVQQFGSFVATCAIAKITTQKIQHAVFATKGRKYLDESHTIRCFCWNCNESEAKAKINEIKGDDIKHQTTYYNNNFIRNSTTGFNVSIIPSKENTLNFNPGKHLTFLPENLQKNEYSRKILITPQHNSYSEIVNYKFENNDHPIEFQWK